MTPDQAAEAVDRLDAYLDGLVGAGPPPAGGEPDPALGATARALHAPDPASDPPPGLRAATWEELMAHPSTMPLPAFPPTQEVPAPTTDDPPGRDGPPLPARLPRRLRRVFGPELSAAAVLLLIVATGYGALRLAGDDTGSGPGGDAERTIAAQAAPADANGCETAPRLTVPLTGEPRDTLGADGGGVFDPRRPGDAPTGAREATEDETAAMRRTLRQLQICLGAHDTIRLYGVFSDDYFRRAMRAGDTTALDLERVTTWALPSERPLELKGATLLADGRAAAIVVDGDSIVVFLVFTIPSGTLQIDEVLFPLVPNVTDTPVVAAAVGLNALDIAWSTNELSVPVGGAINLANRGAAEHTFVIEGVNDDAPVHLPIGGEVVAYALPPDLEPGTYTYYCAVPGHRPLMEGTLTVTRPGGPSARPTPTPAPPDRDGAPDAVLEAVDIAWNQTELRVPVGGTIELVNLGAAEHNFVVEGSNDDAPVDMPVGGAPVRWTVPPDLPPGTYTFYCAVPGHRPLQTGTLTVGDTDGGD